MNHSGVIQGDRVLVFRRHDVASICRKGNGSYMPEDDIRADVEKFTVQGRIAAAGRDAFTQTAIAGGRAMGLTVADMLSVIISLSRHDFYKSMTTRNDHRVWQDVYHGTCPTGQIAYIKLTEVAERIVIQFKEK